MSELKNDVEKLSDLVVALQEAPRDEDIRFNRRMRREKSRLLKEYNRLNFKVQRAIIKLK